MWFVSTRKWVDGKFGILSVLPTYKVRARSSRGSGDGRTIRCDGRREIQSSDLRIEAKRLDSRWPRRTDKREIRSLADSLPPSDVCPSPHHSFHRVGLRASSRIKKRVSHLFFPRRRYPSPLTRPAMLVVIRLETRLDDCKLRRRMRRARGMMAWASNHPLLHKPPRRLRRHRRWSRCRCRCRCRGPHAHVLAKRLLLTNCCL